MFNRRAWMLAAAAATAGHWSRDALALPPKQLQFPRDFGSHPDLRTEWWYITGHATSDKGRVFGFQVTFFRSRVEATQAMRSHFAAKQLVFAHTALTDLEGRTLLHDQRMARTAGGQAFASETDTDLRLRNWSLVRRSGQYHALIAAEGFTLDLQFTPTQPVLLQGDKGLSRKGPEPAQASYYYSVPHLATQGRIVLQGRSLAVKGTAWLDHEASDALMHPEAVGWDWIGMNLDDGAALTAFHLRRADGSTLWAGGSLRTAAGVLRVFQANEVRFEAQSHWLSPHTQARYPTRWRVHTPAGSFTVQALLDDQELDSRNSTGAVYWEGLSDLLGAQGQRVGRGYLEMTGYAAPLKL